MDSQQISIAKYLIHETPIGHLNFTFESLKNILGLNPLDNETIRKEIAKYNEEHLNHIIVEDNKLLVSSVTKDESGNYLDQNANIKVKVSADGTNAESTEEISSEESPLRIALHKSLIAYKEKNYKSAITAVNGKLLINNIKYSFQSRWFRKLQIVNFSS